MDHSIEKKKAALLSVSSNTALIISKLFIGLITGSISIISEAIHSFTDLLAAIIAYYSVKFASEPADTEHQFGHGKFEDLSGGIEGLLILAAAGYIIYEAFEKIITHSFQHLNTTWGIVVMLFSAIVNILVSSYLFKIAKKTDSMALLADAQHLKTDILTSVGVLIGLLLIKLTGCYELDSIVAITVALLIIKAGFDLCLTSAKNLLDTSLPEDERKLIKIIVMNFMPDKVLDFKSLKTRKAGAERVIEFTLIVPENMTVKESHDLCDKIEKKLSEEIKNPDITIHIEPCDESCPECGLFHKDLQVCQNLKDKEI